MLSVWCDCTLSPSRRIHEKKEVHGEEGRGAQRGRGKRESEIFWNSNLKISPFVSLTRLHIHTYDAYTYIHTIYIHQHTYSTTKSSPYSTVEVLHEPNANGLTPMQEILHEIKCKPGNRDMTRFDELVRMPGIRLNTPTVHPVNTPPTLPLREAILHRSLYAAQQLLLNEALPNQVINDHHFRPLSFAISNGRPKFVKLLLESGADLVPQYRQNAIRECLNKSHSATHKEILKLVLDHGGAELLYSQTGGKTNLEWALEEWNASTWTFCPTMSWPLTNQPQKGTLF